MPPSKVALPPFDHQPGIWLRCAFHVHTTESDGWLTPVSQRKAHAWAGYDVLCITDHDKLTPEPDGDDSLLVIGGTEISLTAPQSGGPLHLLGLGIESMPAVARTASLADAAIAVRESGGLPFLAHPVWSGLRTSEVEGIEHCAGVEIFNASCEIEQSRGESGTHWDSWLTAGYRLGGIATDDTHYPGWDAFRGWTLVHARERSRAAVIEALSAGHYYATSGPRILGIKVDNDAITVHTTPARAITGLANPPYGARVAAGSGSLAYRSQRLPTVEGQSAEGIADGEYLTGAVFPLRPGPTYGRIVVDGSQGGRAWSNPIWFGDQD